MSDNVLSNSIIEPTEAQPRYATVGGSCTDAEKERIVLAFQQFGWNQSNGVRLVLLAFAESATVRDTVFSHIKTRNAAA
jgi:hypothetical protein